MNNTSVITAIIVLLIGANNNMISIVECDPNTTITFVECNPITWAPNDPYGLNVYDTLVDLLNATPVDPNYSSYVNGTNRGTTIYGYASCNVQLDPDDCLDCLEECADQLGDLCSSAIGAQVVMVDCKMRYENYQFY